MVCKKVKSCIIFSIVTVLIFSATASNILSKNTVEKDFQLNNIVFIEKSNGLDNPGKEGGKTEYELADINNDGHLDLISVGDHGSPYINSNQHGIMVWFGDGNGIWSVSQVGNFGYGGIEAGDLNLDGFLDVAWGIHHNYGPTGFGDTLIGAALGDGTGSNWIPWATGLGTAGEDWGMFATDLADFDCDGLLDIVSQSFGCCNGYHVYKNNNDGTWTHKWTNTGGNTYNNLETADFNSDGYPDFAGNRDGYFVYLGNGEFGFTLNQNGLPSSNWLGLDCGDANNDGCDDIVFGYSSLGVRCYTFDKQNNNWVLASNGLPTSGQYYPQFGDMNGDGFLDIFAYKPPLGTLYLGDGNGNWVADGTCSMPSPGSYSAIVVDGDFDHDGREDVVIQAEQGSWPSYQNKLKAFSPWSEPSELTSLVQTPNGGETFRSGSIRKIRWLSAVPSAQGDSSVEIQISLNGETGPWNTIASGLPNNGCYQWLVDAGGSEYCRIKIIVSTSFSSAYAISQSDFKIIGFNVNAHGPYQAVIGEPIHFIGSAENGTPPYNYFWDFGDGEFSYEQNPEHAYTTEGNFSVVLSVTDGSGVTIRDSTWALIIGNNTSPNTPEIDGPSNGKPKINYNFTFVSTDFDNDDLYYFIDWGDETNTGWIGPFISGEKITQSHSWFNKGNYTIYCKVKDTHNAESEWKTKEIIIPRNKNVEKRMFQSFIEKIINLFLKQTK
ncbi:MAG: FG-GAP-like repeat-containing protein [Candidatus Thermoplasmatota archaeon]|nr:FG-GAP-like repeat-containing protein [Candidatus Thermoplasmatota archaeon]